MACGNEGAVFVNLAALVGMLGEDLAGPADEPVGGFIAGAGDDVNEDQNLLARQLAICAGLVGKLDIEQLGHQIVRRIFDAPVEIFLVALADETMVGIIAGLAGLGAQVFIDARLHALEVFLGDAEQHADDAQRHFGAEIIDEIEAPAFNQRVQRLGAKGADLRLQRVHLFGREHAGEQAAMHGVQRRVFEDENAGRDGHVLLDDLKNAAAAGDEGIAVEQAALDILVAAHRVEIILLVVIERRFLAQPGPGRIGVGEIFWIIRVPMAPQSHSQRSSQLLQCRGRISRRCVSNRVRRGAGPAGFGKL